MNPFLDGISAMTDAGNSPTHSSGGSVCVSFVLWKLAEIRTIREVLRALLCTARISEFIAKRERSWCVLRSPCSREAEPIDQAKPNYYDEGGRTVHEALKILIYSLSHTFWNTNRVDEKNSEIILDSFAFLSIHSMLE